MPTQSDSLQLIEACERGDAAEVERLLDGLMAADAFGGLQCTDDFCAELVEHVY